MQAGSSGEAPLGNQRPSNTEATGEGVARFAILLAGRACSAVLAEGTPANSSQTLLGPT